MQKILTAKIAEFKCLKDFELDTQGGKNILLIGENGIGKSSIMQIIQIAIGRKTDIPPNATGEGEIVIDKDGKQFTFQVKFKDGKPVVTVTSPEGMRDTRKSAIAGIVGPIDFDIEEFISLSRSEAGRKKQVEIFKGFLSQEDRDFFSKMEAHVKVNEDERLALGRDVKTLKGKVESSKFKVESDESLATFAFTDTKKIMEELDQKQKANEKRKEVEDRLVQRTLEAEKIEKQMEELVAKLGILQEKNIEASNWLEQNLQNDVASLQTTLASAGEANATYQEVQTFKADRAKLTLWETEYGEYGAKINTAREEVARTIKEMCVPVQGLSFDDFGLVYNGVAVHPDSLSESEQMELGVRLKIAENPEAPLFLERTESYGAKRWQAILDLCAKNNIQIIGEQVMRGKEELVVEIIGETPVEKLEKDLKKII